MLLLFLFSLRRAHAKGTATTWVWHGSSELDDDAGARDRTLVHLSPGGSDADTTREFDLAANAWVADDDGRGAFALPHPAKTDAAYRSRDEVLVGTDFGPGSLTTSGYPRVVKSWARGEPLSAARTVFEGEETDVACNMYAYRDRGFLHEFQRRSVTFYTSKHWWRAPTSLSAFTAATEPVNFIN